MCLVCDSRLYGLLFVELVLIFYSLMQSIRSRMNSVHLLGVNPSGRLLHILFGVWIFVVFIFLVVFVRYRASPSQ